MRQIDPKYRIVFDEIVKVSNGEEIPHDEPLILFRAKDRLAVSMLHKYLSLCIDDGCTPEHLNGVVERIAAFARFASEHPERMKQPGCTRDK